MTPKNGHSLDTVNLHLPTITNVDAPPGAVTLRAKDEKTVVRPRLLSLKQAAEYVGVSYWLLRDWCIDGTLRPVRLPGGRLKKGGCVVANSKDHSMRKIMVDRADLDRMIEDGKG